MEETIAKLITTAAGLGILGAAYLLDLIIGSIKVWFTKDAKWSIKKAGEDFLKAVILALGIECWVALWEALSWYCGQCGVDITSIADGFSTSGMIAAIIGGSVWYLKNAFTNAVEFINTNHIQVSVDKIEYSEVTGKVYELFETPREAVEMQQADEAEYKETGAMGVYYQVPIDSYDSFRNAVNGNGYDMDGVYGFQCWDGGCLLWQQLGRWLSTGGTGAARGCWTNAWEENAGENFDTITNIADIKRGDVMVFGCGNYGHIGYADEDYNDGATIKLLGQNQSTDKKFCVINMNVATFLGAFRLKSWKTAEPDSKKKEESSEPEPTSEPTSNTREFQVGDKVVPTRLVDYNGTKLVQYDKTYEITQINGDRAVLSARGQVWAAMNIEDLQKA